MTQLSEDNRPRALKILIVGNYVPDRQYSMLLFSRMLHENLRSLKVQADLLHPSVVLGKLARSDRKAGKLFGLIDKYLLFPPLLWWRAGNYDCIHITDHSNSPYQFFIGKAAIAITCHDLFAVQIFLGEVPGQRFGIGGRLLQRCVLGSLSRINTVICDSAHSAAEFNRIIKSTAKIQIIPPALSSTFIHVEPHTSSSEIAKLGLPADQPFFLHVGGNQYYKNRQGVVKLFESLAVERCFANHNLVLAGHIPDAALMKVIEVSPVRDRIQIVTGSSDEQIRALYNRATALLFISLKEGFGWPILEAQACGCIVVTSDLEPMCSVAGNGAIFIDPTDPVAGSRMVASAVNHFSSLRKAGYQNVSRYAPDQIFPKYIGVYRGAIGERRAVRECF